ncbi:MAG: FAD-dependent oxidoreductase [Gammaproteobacteria bacterium TMED78]|nr:MAG: FAD-dependent oxidoreductase [Gammaproteobacteria bacterium TMED78]
MKIAIVGSGVSSNVAAYHLNKNHDITVFEANNYVGGHVNTIDFDLDGDLFSIDTGFIVFNDKTYPNFITLLEELNIQDQLSDMSFSVSCRKSGLEYSGTNLNTIFSQRRNLLNYSHHLMLLNILKFNTHSIKFINQVDSEILLGDYLSRMKYSKYFIEKYLLPMSSAIWSSDPKNILIMPLKFLVNFFENHGLLSLANRPTWKVIKGGSKNYVEKLVLGFSDKIKLNSKVESILRFPDRVEIFTRDRGRQSFDYVFLGCHSDQALKILADPSRDEESTLSAIKYQSNEAILHTDEDLLPNNRRAWASWNYNIPEKKQESTSLTYNMNLLQKIDSKYTFCVTLNNSSKIRSSKIIKRVEYSHPIFTNDAVNAQKNHYLINKNRTFFCGAYWYNGFHEDGVVSALEAVKYFEASVINE